MVNTTTNKHDAAPTRIQHTAHTCDTETTPTSPHDPSLLSRLPSGFHLPARHVIHTVGPIYEGDELSQPLLASAYR